MKCKHEQVCQQCVQAEIKKHEDAIAELRKKLPPFPFHFVSGFGRDAVTVPYVPQYPNPWPVVIY